MKTKFTKVAVEERLPETKAYYITNEGILLFFKPWIYRQIRIQRRNDGEKIFVTGKLFFLDFFDTFK